MSTPVDEMLKTVEWKPCEPPKDDEDNMPFATHEGIWHFGDAEIRCYRLNTGEAIIHADDFAKFFGL